MSGPVKAKCAVVDAMVEPCNGLGKAFQYTQRQGISMQTLMDMKTGQITRSYMVLRSGEFSKNGIVLNFCPFCGERISEHIAKESA